MRKNSIIFLSTILVLISLIPYKSLSQSNNNGLKDLRKGAMVISSNWGKQNWGEGKSGEKVWEVFKINRIIQYSNSYQITMNKDGYEVTIEIPKTYTHYKKYDDDAIYYFYLIKGFKTLYFEVATGKNGGATFHISRSCIGK